MGVTIDSSVLEKTDSLSAQLVEIRRKIHRHPEFGFEEFETPSLVCSVLDELGMCVLMRQWRRQQHGVVPPEGVPWQLPHPLSNRRRKCTVEHHENDLRSDIHIGDSYHGCTSHAASDRSGRSATVRLKARDLLSRIYAPRFASYACSPKAFVGCVHIAQS